jgi:DNA repair protein RadC
MPEDERLRERLVRYGPSALQTAELLAIIMRVGAQQENVMELSSRLLREYGGLGGLAGADIGELCGMHGMGEGKASLLKAALELGRRLSVMGPGRPQITRPDDVANLLRL